MYHVRRLLHSGVKNGSSANVIEAKTGGKNRLNRLRTFQPENRQKLRNSNSQSKLTGSQRKKSVGSVDIFQTILKRHHVNGG